MAATTTNKLHRITDAAVNSHGYACLSRWLMAGVLLASSPVHAQWSTIEENLGDPAVPVQVARVINEEGYSLEIYRDRASAVRSRFTLRNGLTSLESRTCPTYQIDQRPPDNLSADRAPCLASSAWAEYILGDIRDEEIRSPLLLAMMDGNVITYRFRLANGDYRETRFSLAGSKRSMTLVIGEQVRVRAN